VIPGIQTEVDMKIGVISDSHEDIVRLRRAVSYFNTMETDLVIHCGDIISPIMTGALKELDCPVRAVFGNNDGEKIFLGEKFSALGSICEPPLEFDEQGVKFRVTHKPWFYKEAARSSDRDFILFGHTHEALLYEVKKDGTDFFVGSQQIFEEMDKSVDQEYVHVMENGSRVALNPGEVCGLLAKTATCVLLDTEQQSITFKNINRILVTRIS
jgi:putative phosphoesterase